MVRGIGFRASVQRRTSSRRGVFLGALAVLAVVLMAFAPGALASVTGAVNTTDDPAWNGPSDSGVDASGNAILGAPTQACLNGGSHTTPAVNCNIYLSKNDVFLSGSPTSASLSAGTYFYAVLDPGGQANPNDGSPDLLSTDTAANREFSTDGSGNVTPLNNAPTETPHAFDDANQLIQVAPYNDTSNPGGEYILAVCELSTSQSTSSIAVATVDPRDCKYDAFKVKAASNGGLSDLSVFKTATPSFTRTFSWDAAKSVDKTLVTTSAASDATFNYTVTATWTQPSDSDSGWAVKGKITVTNPNSEDFAGVTLSDQIFDATAATPTPDPNATCSITDSSDTPVTAPVTIQTGDTIYNYTCSYSSAGPVSSFEQNVATATWDPTQYVGTTGTANWEVPFTWDDDSTGNPTLADTCANVTDAFNGGSATALGQVCTDGTSTASWTGFTSPGSITYDGSSTFTFTYSRTVKAPSGTCTSYDNTADFTTNDSGATDPTPGDNSTTVKVCGAADLTVAKTAAPGYTRTYNWTIKKTVNKNYFDQASGTVTPSYTVVVTELAPTDSAIQAAGTITVSNPNDFETITLTDVTDAVDNGGSCSFSTGTSLTPAVPEAALGKAGTVTLNYTCTYSALPADGTNTATATWDATPASTADGTASGHAAVSFGGPTNPVNKTITPTDAFNGGTAVNLCTLQTTAPCTLTATDPPTAATTRTYTYTRSIAVKVDMCATYPNTAATGTGATSSQTVTVCGGVAGELTMGYWQNKNGQGIISGGSFTGTAKVCNSGTWLRTYYAPFQDLSATATCAQVATYVYNIIKAATAAGPTMNAMLKAQMLATALDVYFSDPTLGGNKIGAPKPLGGVEVDLTKICVMIDSSGGTGSCSGATESVSAAFGGATVTELTVSQMLAYAASQSNVGGTSWYGQNKTTQGLAKNAFDAINNGAAFTGP